MQYQKTVKSANVPLWCWGWLFRSCFKDSCAHSLVTLPGWCEGYVCPQALISGQFCTFPRKFLTLYQTGHRSWIKTSVKDSFTSAISCVCIRNAVIHASLLVLIWLTKYNICCFLSLSCTSYTSMLYISFLKPLNCSSVFPLSFTLLLIYMLVFLWELCNLFASKALFLSVRSILCISDAVPVGFIWCNFNTFQCIETLKCQNSLPLSYLLHVNLYTMSNHAMNVCMCGKMCIYTPNTNV